MYYQCQCYFCPFARFIFNKLFHNDEKHKIPVPYLRKHFLICLKISQNLGINVSTNLLRITWGIIINNNNSLARLYNLRISFSIIWELLNIQEIACSLKVNNLVTTSEPHISVFSTMYLLHDLRQLRQ